jgi:Fe-S cluster assembly scaffold protein SufB
MMISGLLEDLVIVSTALLDASSIILHEKTNSNCKSYVMVRGQNCSTYRGLLYIYILS